MRVVLQILAIIVGVAFGLWAVPALQRPAVAQVCANRRGRDTITANRRSASAAGAIVLDIGPLHATTEREHTVPLPPVLGMAAIASGVALMIGGVRKRA
jgi:hypothetical protein